MSGIAWGWGKNTATGTNTAGDVGDNTIVTKSSPVQVSGSFQTWAKLSPGAQHQMALKNDGTIWGWGFNSNGQIGDKSVVSRSSPVQVGSLATWVEVSCGGFHSLAINTSGQLWSWGYNYHGELGYAPIGLAAGANRSSPVIVGSLTNWKKVAGGGNHSLAIDTSGKLWAWGYNIFGSVGDKTTVTRSSPVAVGSLTTWTLIAAGRSNLQSFGIQSDGTLWAWGANVSGSLGVNISSATNFSSPTQVGGNKWQFVAAGGSHTLAIQTDGSLWSWGSNAQGQLGTGEGSLIRSSPVMIPGTSGWMKVAAGANHSLGLKTDGSIWAWGQNTNGELGDKTSAGKSSPVQIGSLNSWGDIIAMVNGGVAIQTVADLVSPGFLRNLMP